MKQVRKRLTYANVMSSLAIFLVLGGATAFAASHLAKNSVGSKQLKKNAVTAAKIKANAVTGAKIQKNAVGPGKIQPGTVGATELAGGSVGTNQLANGAVNASKLANGAVGSAQLGGNSVGNAQTSQVKVFTAGTAAAAADQASAEKIELGSVGPFRFYGKCFLEGGKVMAREYIELTSGVGFFSTENSDRVSGPTKFLTPSTPENERELQEDAEAAANTYDAAMFDEEFQAASGSTDISGLTGTVAAKQGSLPEGDGPFLPGDSCLIGALSVFGS